MVTVQSTFSIVLGAISGYTVRHHIQNSTISVGYCVLNTNLHY
jgi:hypothetical protein